MQFNGIPLTDRFVRINFRSFLSVFIFFHRKTNFHLYLDDVSQSLKNSQENEVCYLSNEVDLLIHARVVVFHVAPVPPSEDDHRRAAVHFEHLPCEDRNHPLEELMTRRKVVPRRIVVLVRGNQRVVRAHFEHPFSVFRRATVERHGVDGGVDGAPVVEAHLVGRFDLPVLHEILDDFLKTARLVVPRSL